jgi:hypothetical protein
MVIHCGDCEHYTKSFDRDRHRICRATGLRHWPGDSAYRCPHLVISLSFWEAWESRETKEWLSSIFRGCHP